MTSPPARHAGRCRLPSGVGSEGSLLEGTRVTVLGLVSSTGLTTSFACYRLLCAVFFLGGGYSMGGCRWKFWDGSTNDNLFFVFRYRDLRGRRTIRSSGNILFNGG